MRAASVQSSLTFQFIFRAIIRMVFPNACVIIAILSLKCTCVPPIEWKSQCLKCLIKPLAVGSLHLWPVSLSSDKECTEHWSHSCSSDPAHVLLGLEEASPFLSRRTPTHCSRFHVRSLSQGVLPWSSTRSLWLVLLQLCIVLRSFIWLLFLHKDTFIIWITQNCKTLAANMISSHTRYLRNRCWMANWMVDSIPRTIKTKCHKLGVLQEDRYIFSQMWRPDI